MENELFWAQLKKWGFAPMRFERAVEVVEARRFPPQDEEEPEVSAVPAEQEE